MFVVKAEIVCLDQHLPSSELASL